MKTKLIAVFCSGLFVFSLAPLSVALAQVEEAESSWVPSNKDQEIIEQEMRSSNTDTGLAVSQDQSLNMAQRMSIVEQSLSNINQMDFPNQIVQLEQEVQQLRGNVDVLEHKIKQLQTLQKQKAQELSQHVEKLPATEEVNSNALAVSAASTPVGKSESGIETETEAESIAVEAINPNLPPEAQAKRTYDAAFGLVQAHAYDDAITAFQGYLKIYGDESAYSANAYYWLGELYAHQQQYDQAQKMLLKVVDDYSQSNKTPDAILKLGIVEQKQGEIDQANKWFEEVISDYPDSASARLAKNYLH